MAGRDITEGRAERSIAVDVGVVSSTAVWQNTDIAYDVAIGGMPFVYAISDARPYARQTAPFKKDQFDNGAEPGEQSLTGWWLRSQQSFHSGAGIKFYDPGTLDDSGHYRFYESKGVDVWTKGQVTLLKNCTASSHPMTGAIASNGTPQQHIRSIKWNNTSGVLVRDEYDVDKIAVDGTVTHFIDYNTGAGVYPVYAICDDGTKAYWATNATSGATTKFTVYGKPLTGSSASTADEFKIFDNSQIVSNAAMDYVKDRLVICADNKVYECATAASSTPTTVYTHPSSTHVYTSVTASGAAIYVAGYNGIQSSIQRFTLSSSGSMPTLTSAITAAEMPVGEIIHKIYHYLGYVMIGTNKGVRVASTEADGSLTYGPLVVETSQPCYDFAARDHYVWCATGVDGAPGVIRIDLSNELETLRFAYANDLYMDGVSGFQTTGCAFADGTNRLVFVTAKTGATNGSIYIEDASTLRPSGYLTTGNIRFGTLEPKNFKRLLGRGDFTYGSMTLETVDSDGTEYDHIAYDASVSPIEVTTNQPATAQEYVAYKFILYRDGTTSSQGPIFKGYQAKATIATPRQRLIQFPVYCYDTEADRYNAQFGYAGRALDRIQRLEQIEESGDIVTFQDLSTNESFQVQIEKQTFTRLTPPDRESNNFGGIIEIVVRTV